MTDPSGVGPPGGAVACPRGHPADRIETRPDGRRVCRPCQDHLSSRANAARRRNQSTRAKRATPNGAPNHARKR